MGRFTTSLINSFTFLVSIACATYSAYGLHYFYPDFRRGLHLLPRALHEFGYLLECAVRFHIYFLCFFGLASSTLCLFGIITKKAKLSRLFAAYWVVFGASAVAEAIGISNNIYEYGELKNDLQ
ncbi:hypothetical protein L596_025303 [Steinernema carpocapsae]|uniref:Uncharacterized protein n=1 Tax=Steinernema carpocapsae TaxID=34508 RepID=A0A4U5M7G1_STECR|nr:hypothetical protein L596_025303 [Steinernema carpocapsae]